MSTGAEHYRKAEELLEEMSRPSGEGERLNTFLEALTHAVLANSAATALGLADDHGMPPVDNNDWLTAASADNYGHGNPDDDEPSTVITEELLAASLTEICGGPVTFAAPVTREGSGVSMQVQLPVGVTTDAVLRPDKFERLLASLGRRESEVSARMSLIRPGRVLSIWIADKTAQ